MKQNLVARSSITVNAPASRVWKALVTPQEITQYMFGTTVISDWKKGSAISWKGEWQGRSYQDHGTILQITPERLLQYSHFSPLSGLPDRPENYHTVTIELHPDDGRTGVTLTQDNNPTPEARQHSQENWDMMLAGLKKLVAESK